MPWSVVLYLAVTLTVVLLVLRRNSHRGGTKSGVEESWPFYLKVPLSVPEQVLYFRLANALPHHIVLAQVQLSRLLGVKKGNNFQTWFNRISRLSADFVVCNKDSSVVAVIELDDASHERKDRQTTDARKNKALGSAGVRIVRWKTKTLPDETAIKNCFSPDGPASE